MSSNEYDKSINYPSKIACNIYKPRTDLYIHLYIHFNLQ